jgi:tol-pal system protein YbgF
LFALGLATAPAGAGFAQSQTLNDRVNQLENQVQTLSRSVYRGAPPPSDGGAGMISGGGGDAGVFEQRISDLENQQRQLTGQIEEANHRSADLQARLDKLQADYDMRFQQLEGGARPAAASTSATDYSASPGASISGGTATAPENASVSTDGAKTLGTLPSGGVASGAAKPESLYESAFGDVRNAQYDEAATKFRQFLNTWPQHSLAGNAQYWLAETYYVRGDFKESAKLFAKGYQDYPQGTKAADSLLKLGLSLSKLDRKDDACLSFKQLQKEFPGETAPAAKRAAQEIKTLGCG